MIALHRNHFTGSPSDLRIKIVGLGGAGSNALDRILLDGVPGAELVAINTDAQALTASVAAEKVQLGRATTRGLGAGGDPEVGYAAAEEGVEEIRRALEGTQMVFLCVGLGGGTGSGAARIVASLAREQAALVIAFATLPFSFEGKRRHAQAEEALAALQREADVVVCFENDRMGEGVSPLAGIQDAFKAADEMISQSVRAIASLVQQRGLVHIGFDELAHALRGGPEASPRCLFGYGEADGDNRAHEALALALKSPLMDKGRMLEHSQNVLVNIAGGPGMTLNEVQILMEELNRHLSDETRILFGTAVDPRLGQKMTVTLLSALETETAGAGEAPRLALRAESLPASFTPPPATSVPRVRELPTLALHRVEPLPGPGVPQSVEKEPAREPEHSPRIAYVDSDEAVHQSEPVGAAETARLAVTAPTVASTAAAAAAAKTKLQAKQEQMQFEPVTRGRFEKSEPTIVDGQDLDVPTFLRRNVRVK